MGTWGFRLFQNDQDLDTIGDMAIELDLESLYFPDCPKFVKEELETDGKLDSKLSEIVNAQGGKYENKTKMYVFSLLVASAMAVGAKISREHLDRLSRSLAHSNCGFSDEGRQTLLDALKVYDPEGRERLQVGGRGLNTTMKLRMEHARIEREKQGITAAPMVPFFFVGSSMGHMSLRDRD